jgi:hypothetical protein
MVRGKSILFVSENLNAHVFRLGFSVNYHTFQINSTDNFSFAIFDDGPDQQVVNRQ